MSVLEINDLHVCVGDTEILRGVNLTVRSGEVHAVMGPNGAGKSTLSSVVMGRPGYDVTAGTITLDGEDMLALPTWQRATAGLHLVMQYPTEVPGVFVDDVLAEALSTRGRDSSGIADQMLVEAERIGFDERFLRRPLNVDLSGGEKKRNETLQLAVLNPKVAILDELDSGLDIDALRACSRRVQELSTPDGAGGPGLGVVAITHYSRLLNELRPDKIHIMVRGQIVATGGPELAAEIERDGYSAFGDASSAEPESNALNDLFSL